MCRVLQKNAFDDDFAVTSTTLKKETADSQ